MASHGMAGCERHTCDRPESQPLEEAKKHRHRRKRPAILDRAIHEPPEDVVIDRRRRDRNEEQPWN